jgi:hypothetical protein
VDPFGGRTHQAILYRIPIAARPIPAINETILNNWRDWESARMFYQYAARVLLLGREIETTP